MLATMLSGWENNRGVPCTLVALTYKGWAGGWGGGQMEDLGSEPGYPLPFLLTVPLWPDIFLEGSLAQKTPEPTGLAAWQALP